MKINEALGGGRGQSCETCQLRYWQWHVSRESPVSHSLTLCCSSACSNNSVHICLLPWTLGLLVLLPGQCRAWQHSMVLNNISLRVTSAWIQIPTLITSQLLNLSAPPHICSRWRTMPVTVLREVGAIMQIKSLALCLIFVNSKKY